MLFDPWKVLFLWSFEHRGTPDSLTTGGLLLAAPAFCLFEPPETSGLEKTQTQRKDWGTGREWEEDLGGK